EVALAFAQRQYGGAHGADGRRLGRGGKAEQDRAEHQEDQQQRRQQRAEEFAPVHRAQFFLGQRGQLRRREKGHHHQVKDVQADQQQAGNQRAHEQVADRNGLRREDAHLQLCLLIGAGHHVTQQNQHDGRRDDLPEGTGGGQGAGGNGWVVAAAQHGWQRQQAQGYHGGADDAGRRGEQRTDQAHGDR